MLRLLVIRLDNLLDFVINIMFDFRYGIRTGGVVPLHEMDISSHTIFHGKKYQGVRLRLLKKALNCLDLSFDNYTFIDLGCGKGRAIAYAVSIGFKKVVGIDFAKEMCIACAENMDILNNYLGGKGFQYEIIYSDVLEASVPKGNRVFFMYNPFNEYVLDKLLKKSVSHTSPDDCWIYVNSRYGHVFNKNGFVEIACIKSINFNKEVKIFRRESR